MSTFNRNTCIKNIFIIDSILPFFFFLLLFLYPHSYTLSLHLWTLSVVFLFSSYKYIHNPPCTCPNHFNLAFLNLSPNHSTLAVLLRCLFLILSILVTPNENLNILTSATSSLSSFHFSPLNGLCYQTQTPAAALLEVSGSGRFTKFYYYLHKEPNWRRKHFRCQVNNNLMAKICKYN